jgi:hypothetical protein
MEEDCGGGQGLTKGWGVKGRRRRRRRRRRIITRDSKIKCPLRLGTAP